MHGDIWCPNNTLQLSIPLPKSNILISPSPAWEQKCLPSFYILLWPTKVLNSPFLQSAQTVPGTAFLLQFPVSLGLGLEAATSTTQVIIRIVKHDISPAHSPSVHQGTIVHLNIRVHMLLSIARLEAYQPSIIAAQGDFHPSFSHLGDCVVCHCLGYLKTKSTHPGKHLPCTTLLPQSLNNHSSTEQLLAASSRDLLPLLRARTRVSCTLSHYPEPWKHFQPAAVVWIPGFSLHWWAERCCTVETLP